MFSFDAESASTIASLTSPRPEQEMIDREKNEHELMKLTSRVNIWRQASALLLGSHITPALSKKLSCLNIFPEFADIKGVTLFYCTGWDKPCIHYKSSAVTEIWTYPPGEEMKKASDDLLKQIAFFLAEGTLLETDSVWTIDISGADHLEFVPNNHGIEWDKPQHGGNYLIESPGRYFLKSGLLHPIVPPPDRPALVSTASITASSVHLVWNGPIARLSDVSAYQVFRDNSIIATLDYNTFEYEDRDLIGLTEYTYYVKAVNKHNIVGQPSDHLVVTTGEPDKPSEVQNLTISNHSEQSIKLSWQKPYDNGGGPIEIYRIYRDGAPVGLKPCTSNTWESWTDTKVEPKGTYIYHVTACRYLPPRDTPESCIPSPSTEVATTTQRLASRLFRLPSMPVSPPPATKDLKQLTEYLSECIKNRNYEGRVAVGIEGKAVFRLILPRINDHKTHIILQAFNWHSCDDPKGYYSVLSSRVDKLESAGITMVWLPPPSASVSPQGYMPTRWYDLNTAYGKESDLRQLISGLRNSGITSMLDLVVNHRCGVKKDDKGGWTVFEDPDWGSWAIVSNNLQGYTGQGATDTGASSPCAPDLDHTNEGVRRDTKKWIRWLFDEVGFGALRIDMAPGYATAYQVEYVQSLGNPFTVGEYWSGDSNALQNYTKAGRGLIAAFDFALYYILRRSIESGNFSELSAGGRVPGLTGRDPIYSVTFIDNHDTIHLDTVGKFAGWNKDAVLRGCVYLLTHPGTPCIYLDYFFDFGDWFFDKLATLTRLRHEVNLTAECGVFIAQARDGLYSAYISRDRYCHYGGGHIAMKLGRDNWSPEGDGWTVKTTGNDYCVWSR